MLVPRALGARGALAGALGGLAAGGLDFALSVGRASAFLPEGKARLLLFLCMLYGAAGAAVGALVGLAAAGLGWSTDLGPMWRAAFSGEAPKEPGRRVVAYTLAAVLVALAHGYALQTIALDALNRYHHPFLIAALVGAAAAGLAVPLAAVVFMLAAVLSPLVKIGPRLPLRLAAPAGLYAAGWALGLLAGAAAVAKLLSTLMTWKRMSRPLQAMNTALWAPTLVLASLLVLHLAVRLVARRWTPRALRRPGVALGALVLALGLPVAIAAALQWKTVRQLDQRPFVALALALAVALSAALYGVGLPLGRMRTASRAAFTVALPGLMLLLALSTGRADRVRKAAISFTGLTAPLVRGLHAATDLDRDGYASVLGGGDCDDFDREVHPGALDWPDDGVDQDCNGNQASLVPQPPRRYAALPAAVPSQPNVLLLTVDAVRADHVGAYGYAKPTTPNLDALAAEGVRFANGWAHAPSTRYSVPAILTGRYPSTIPVGNANWPPNVLPQNRLFAEIMKEAGYRTAALLSYHYFARSWGLDQGFDDYDVSLQTLHSMGGDPAKTAGSSAKQLADLNVAWIEKHADKPFFLWTHFYDTHFMFERHPGVMDFGSDEKALYDGEIRFTDEQLGRIFAALQKAGVWQKTIVIVTADHGEGFGEHGLPQTQRHGYHLYRNETKVPLIVRIPGVPARVVEDPVGHIDILPTLLNALGRPAEAEPQLLGTSALGLMLGERDTRRKVYQEVWYEGPTSRKAVVDGSYHLIHNLIPDDTFELYDQHQDPGEEHDLAGSGGDAEQALKRDLAAWMDRAALPADFKRKVEGNVGTAAIPSALKLGDTLGDWLVVEGADLARDGNTVDIALVLRATARVPDGWGLFMHLVAPNGRRLHADHVPLEGIYPLQRLQPGTWLRDRVKQTLPADWPDGPITVEVGLWGKGQRAKARGPHVQADAVRIAPKEGP